MFAATHLTGFAAGGGVPPVTRTFLDHDTSNSFGTSKTFSMDCGAGGDIVACVSQFSNGTFTGVTIGGVTATQQVLGEVSTTGHTAIYTASGVPAGTQDVVITINGAGTQDWSCQLYSISGQSSLVPQRTATDTAGNPITATLPIPRGGLAIGIAIVVSGDGVSDSSIAWSGLIEDAEDAPRTITAAASASDTFADGDSALATSATGSGGSLIGPIGSWAVWGPPESLATATFLDSSGWESSASSSTHTFTGMDCGGGGDIVAVLECHFSGTISSVTIGGVSATIHVQRQAGGTNAPVGIASAAGVPSGSQDVVVTTSGGCLKWGCHTFSLSNIVSHTPTATGSDAHTFGGCSGTLSFVDGGCTIGVTACGNGGTVTWSGLTEDHEDVDGTLAMASAHLSSASADAALSWSTSFGGSNNQTTAAWASWGPA